MTAVQRKDEVILGSLLQSGRSVHPVLLFPLRLQEEKTNALWSAAAEAGCASNVAAVSTSRSPRAWILQRVCPKS